MKSTQLDKLHSFSPVIASSFGLEAAIIFQHVHWVCKKFKRQTLTKREILIKFPYMGRAAVISALSQLLKSDADGPMLMRYNTKSAYPTYRLISKTKTCKLHCFDPMIAMKYGIPAAVIYDDVLKWIIKNDEDLTADEVPAHYQSPRKWAAIHPYIPLRSVERAFKELKEAGELILHGYTDENQPIWTIPLGQGKMDRWEHLRGYTHRKNVNKVLTKVIYLPSILDPDCLDQKEVEITQNAHRQKGTTHRQNGTTDRQN